MSSVSLSTGGASSSRSSDKKRMRPCRAKKDRDAVPVEDPRPRRLVNPLATYRSTTSDLMQIQDLYFPIPDTYSIAYQARLLGFDVPPIVPDTPVPPPTEWKVAKDESQARHVPPTTGFWGRQVELEMEEVDTDPLYRQLLQSSEATTAMNQEQVLRVLLTKQTLVSVRQILETEIKINSVLPPFNIEADAEQISYQFAWFHLPSTGVAELVLEMTLIEKVVQEQDKRTLLVLLCAAFDHARAHAIWYARVVATCELTQNWMQHYFGAERVRQTMCFIVDLHHSSTKLVHLLLRETSSASAAPSWPRRRWLARLPPLHSVLNPTNTPPSVEPTQPILFQSAPSHMKGARVRIQANVDTQSIAITNAQGRPIDTQAVIPDEVPLLLLKDFCMASPMEQQPDEVSDQIEKLARELQAAEAALVPRARQLLRQVTEERINYEMKAPKRRQEQQIMEEYHQMMEMRRRQDLALQQQMEQDMNAVCNVCGDGEVTPDNQILFCENCNVAVHQFCYGIERIPDDDYFCMACKYLDRTDEETKTTELPICCELCPFKLGAFVRTDMPHAGKEGKWVHMVCAKWQGLEYLKPNEPDLVEDVSDMMAMFSGHGLVCDLCEGRRGAMNQCRHEGCKKWMHVTCARASGVCNVIHGEDINGPVLNNPWTLMCQEHSHMKRREGGFTKNQLVKMAQQFPEEDLPEKHVKMHIGVHFDQANSDKRKLIFSGVDRKYERDLLTELTRNRHTFRNRCEVCALTVAYAKEIFRCRTCMTVFCMACAIGIDGSNPKTQESYDACNRCRASKQQQALMVCMGCSQQDGPLCRARIPGAHRKGKKQGANSFFSRQLWIHNLCALWSDEIRHNLSDAVDVTPVVMSGGCSLLHEETPCLLCGHRSGLKVACGHIGCRWTIDGKSVKPYFHATCARQAGFQMDVDAATSAPIAMCYRHCDNMHNLRARLEDMIEHEIKRAGKKFTRAHKPMGFSHAATLLSCAVNVLKTLGWAWRWAEMWVDYDSSWEPLLEPGQREEDLTREELRIVDSSRQSRAEDARRCRLAALGAALRNRAYDTEEDFDRRALDRALRSILKTPSLVGPLQPHEIEFFVDWLGLAYRSKHRYLGFGDNKIPIANKGFGVHTEDGSPKFELGSRPLPGAQELMGRSLFETGITEPDDFLCTTLCRDLVNRTRRGKNSDRKGARAVKAKPTAAKARVPSPQVVVSPPTQRTKDKRQPRLSTKLLDNLNSKSTATARGTAPNARSSRSGDSPRSRVETSKANNDRKRDRSRSVSSRVAPPTGLKTKSKKKRSGKDPPPSQFDESASPRSPVFLDRNIPKDKKKQIATSRSSDSTRVNVYESNYKDAKSTKKRRPLPRTKDEPNLPLTEEERTLPLTKLCGKQPQRPGEAKRGRRRPPERLEMEDWRQAAREEGKKQAMAGILPIADYA